MGKVIDWPAATDPADPLPSEIKLTREFVHENPQLRYVVDRGAWLIWDCKRWAPQHKTGVFSLAMHHLEGYELTARSIQSKNTVAAIEVLARGLVGLESNVLDRDDWLLNTPSGIVDLRKGETRRHDPVEMMTRLATAGPEGDCPTWGRFLTEVTAGDAALQLFLQRMIGYAATGSIREHALFFLYGTGGNGKGVFLNVISELLGDYAAVSPMETFTDSGTDRHPTDLAMLQGRRLVVAQETEEGRRWAESKIKALTGGDPISARFMRQDFFTFLPKFKLIIAGNHKPSLRNVDPAMRRRFNLVPFTVTIPQERQDKELADKLRREAGGIMRWIVEGCLEYQRIGLAPPPAVSEATSEYFSAQDLFGQWLEDCCERGEPFWEPPSRLFASWKLYAEKANERPGAQKSFKDRLASVGIGQGRDDARGRYYAGIKARAQESEPDRRLP